MIPNTLQQYGRMATIRPNYSPEIQERRQFLMSQIREVEANIQDRLRRDGWRQRDIGAAYEEYHRRTQPFYDELYRIELVQTSLIVELS